MKFFATYLFLLITTFSFAQTTVFTGPAGSSINFGINTTILDNGNYVVVDPYYSSGGLFNIGAVHLYDGKTFALISTLTGGANFDGVGNYGIVKLTNGNFVVWSRNWNGGKGAVTWVSATTGLSGVVSSSNSIVGATNGDYIGEENFGNGIFPLLNGNYVVVSTTWQTGGLTQVGAATWGSGTSSTGLVVSSTNSVVGSNANDNIGTANLGNKGVIALPNGNYVVLSYRWNNSRGAATWCNGTTSTGLVISSTNSLVGNNAYNQVGIGSTTGSDRITILANGNYVVNSAMSSGGGPGVGAATWCNGATGRSGVVSSTNSFVGSANYDFSRLVIKPLPNGHYVVLNPWWNNQTGAVTWCDGSTGRTGVVSTTNSFTGPYSYRRCGSDFTLLPNNKYLISTGTANSACWVTWADGSGAITGSPDFFNSLADNDVGLGGIKVLPNGNYVILSPNATSNTIAGSFINCGAATFCNGAAGAAGLPTGGIFPTNSLISSTYQAKIGSGGMFVLANGNYVISSPEWGTYAGEKRGAATLVSGTAGLTGYVDASNSIIGSNPGDFIGLSGIVPLQNSNYLVVSNDWNNGTASKLSAITLCNGTTPTLGSVDATNSLIGSTADDKIGSGSITTLSNGNAVLCSPLWNNGSAVDAGAVTHFSGTVPTVGVLNSTNSLVGNNLNEKIGADGITVLKNGNYVIKNKTWYNGALANAGAATWVNANVGITGTINATNSLIGSTANDEVGYAVTALQNGNYTVNSPRCDNTTFINAGAVTWGNGVTGTKGAVAINNSLMGGQNDDAVGDFGGTEALTKGSYIALSRTWDLPLTSDVGAVTYGNGATGVSGLVNNCFSVIGNYSGNGITSNLQYWYNNVNDYLIVGKRIGPGTSTISIYNPKGMPLANHLDSVTLRLIDTTPVNFIRIPACRLLATVKPDGIGAAQLFDSVKVNVWIQPTVPYHLGIPFVQRHYQINIQNNVPTTATAKVTLYYTQQEFTNFNNDPGSTLDLPTSPNDAAGKANFKLVKYAGKSNDFTGLPVSYTNGAVVIDPDDNDIVWNPNHLRWEVTFFTTGFSGFVVQTNTGTLPLTLLDFSATKQNENVLLNWKTENEINVDKFIVERSENGTIFKAINEKKANNTSVVNFYNSLDTDLPKNITVLFYRLKQIDNDGKFVYSQIVKAYLNKNVSIAVYPNPTSNKIFVSSNAAIKELQFYNNNGQLVYKTIANNSNQYRIAALAKGIYILKTITTNEVVYTKIIKQ